MRDLTLRKIIVIELISTELMRADDKTKVLDKKKFLYCRKMTMNIPESVLQKESAA